MAQFPTGTVTFLFTDIEGSTSRWEQHPGAMQRAVTRHDALLRQAIDAHHGRLVKSTGDGILAAFAQAEEALQAALTAQRSIQAEPWPVEVRLRIRAALY